MDAAERLAHRVQGSGMTLAVAESLTCGSLASAIGATDGASDWFIGGVVAYSDAVKFRVLGVDEGPVVSRECAEQMAQGVARLTGADLAVSATGVGGPGAEEGHPPGTVFIGVTFRGATVVQQRHFPGGPEHVLADTIEAALRLALRALEPMPAPLGDTWAT